jgi:hypothetical protein
VDDSLKLKIAASLDLPTDAAADPDVARALDQDPDARAYARDLHTLDHAMRNWPARARTDAEWERLATRLDAKFEEVARERAKVRKGKKVSPAEPDPAAVPVFEDATTQAPESKLVMSEPQENDAELENLAALTRTSTVPSAMPVASIRPSLTDAVDDTSSGIVDIKKLAEIARAEAEKPAPKAEAKPEADKPEAKPETKPAAKSSSKNDDVMVTPARAATPAVEAPPRKSGSTLWGAIGGMALMAAAFGLYTNMQSRSPNETTGGDVPSTTEAPAAATPTAPTEAQSAPPAAMPSTAVPVAPPPTTQPEMAAPAAESASPTAQTGTVAAPAPPPPTAAPVVADQAPPAAAPRPAEERSAVAREAVARRPVAAPAARAAVVAAPAPAPSVAAEHEVAPQRPAPAAPVAAAPPPPAPTPAARPAATGARSVDDLMNSVAGANGPARAAAAPEPAADLPERPTRSQITGVLSGLNNAVRSCTNGQTGTAPVSLVIANDGSVSSANVSGQFGGSAAGECISGVVRRAHFPRFRAQQVTLTYPFVILPPR